MGVSRYFRNGDVGVIAGSAHGVGELGLFARFLRGLTDFFGKLGAVNGDMDTHGTNFIDNFPQMHQKPVVTAEQVIEFTEFFLWNIF